MVNGTVEADTETQAATKIGQLTLSPVSISAKTGLDLYIDFFSSKSRGISQQEIQIFTRQLATLVGTGIPLVQSLENVANQTENSRFKASLLEIMEDRKSVV